MDGIAIATAIVVSLSGGKDSVACLIWARQDYPDMPILCHHQAMPEDWAETIPYCRQVCRQLDVPLVVEQAIYRRELETFQDGRREWRRRLYLLDLHGRDLPYTRSDIDEGAICGMIDFAHDQGWPPTNGTRWCTAYFKTELYNR